MQSSAAPDRRKNRLPVTRDDGPTERCLVNAKLQDLRATLQSLCSDFPGLPELDIHYLAMCAWGIRDAEHPAGRPSWNIVDSDGLFHITFTLDDSGSPYAIEGDVITFVGSELPFKTMFVERIPVRVRRYYYLRGSRYMTPTLYDKMILNINFRHNCFFCGFCQNLVCSSQADISVADGLRLIMSRGDLGDLSELAEIAICTGCFGSEGETVAHVREVVDHASRLGFQGRLFYMGYEINSPKTVGNLLAEIEQKGLIGLKIVFTVETFQNRSRLMRGGKGAATVQHIVTTLKALSSLPLLELQYSYMPGLDNLDAVRHGAEMLRPYATPHLSIYRSFRPGVAAGQISSDYAELGPRYLCEVRRFYEQLYDGPILGNNLRNMFPLPLALVSPKWTEREIVGDVPDMRYWRGEQRPRGWRVIH